MLSVVGGVMALALWLAVVGASEPYSFVGNGPGQDSRAYYTAPLVDLYATSVVASHGAYLYSPAFAQLLEPAKELPWRAFEGLWAGIAIGMVGYLVRRPVLVAPALAFAFPEVWGGNIHLLLAAAIVAGFRWPGTWAFVLLTKITPGIGLLWFAVRREWRALAIALGTTLAVTAISFAAAPTLWMEWVAVLRMNVGASTAGASVPVPLLVRLPVAIAIVVWGARTDRRWTVPVAAMLALPVLWWGGLAMLVAVIPLGSRRPSTDGATRGDGARGSRRRGRASSTPPEGTLAGPA